MTDYSDIVEKLIQGNGPEVRRLIQKAIDDGEEIHKILQEGLLAGMSVIGERFKKNECYIPEVLMAARAMKEGMEPLRPLIIEKKIKSRGRIVIGTVKGDLHDIGKNLVGMMLEGAGFEIFDVGINVPADTFIEKATENNAQLIGLSCLLTTTLPALEDAITAVKKSPLAKKVKIMIGGAPITQEYADEVGADGYAPDAGHAVDVAKKLIQNFEEREKDQASIS